MDIVEEFIELGRQVAWTHFQLLCSIVQSIFWHEVPTLRLKTIHSLIEVSVSTLVKMLEVIKRRVPKQFLPPLVSIHKVQYVTTRPI